jgi:hypothetical protein
LLGEAHKTHHGEQGSACWISADSLKHRGEGNGMGEEWNGME